MEKFEILDKIKEIENKTVDIKSSVEKAFSADQLCDIGEIDFTIQIIKDERFISISTISELLETNDEEEIFKRAYEVIDDSTSLYIPLVDIVEDDEPEIYGIKIDKLGDFYKTSFGIEIPGACVAPPPTFEVFLEDTDEFYRSFNNPTVLEVSETILNTLVFMKN